jgi:hypothetical protein
MIFSLLSGRMHEHLKQNYSFLGVSNLHTQGGVWVRVFGESQMGCFGVTQYHFALPLHYLQSFTKYLRQTPLPDFNVVLCKNIV